MRRPEVSLDDTQPLDALVSCLRNAANDDQEKKHRSYFSRLRKRLILSTISICIKVVDYITAIAHVGILRCYGFLSLSHESL